MSKLQQKLDRQGFVFALNCLSTKLRPGSLISKFMNSHVLFQYIYYRRCGEKVEKLFKNHLDSLPVIMFSILITTLLYKAHYYKEKFMLVTLKA